MSTPHKAESNPLERLEFSGDLVEGFELLDCAQSYNNEVLAALGKLGFHVDEGQAVYLRSPAKIGIAETAIYQSEPGTAINIVFAYFKEERDSTVRVVRDYYFNRYRGVSENTACIRTVLPWTASGKNTVSPTSPPTFDYDFDTGVLDVAWGHTYREQTRHLLPYTWGSQKLLRGRLAFLSQAFVEPVTSIRFHDPSPDQAAA